MSMHRRRFLTRLGSVAVIGSSMTVSLSRGATASNSVEMDIVASIPANTSIDIILYEDLTGDGNADNQASKDLIDGTQTYVFDTLEGKSNESNAYWIEFNLSTSDTSITPAIDSASIILPDKSASTTTTTTDLAWYESRGESLSTPTRITARISLLLAVVLSIIGFIAMRIKSMIGLIGLGMAIITLLLSMIFHIDFRVFWVAIAFSIILLAIDAVGRMYSGAYT